MQLYSNTAPFEFIMWNRVYKLLSRPAIHKNYKVCFVHGHDIKDKTINNIYNLDNDLGKSQTGNIGNYTVLYSRCALHKHLLYKLQEINNKENKLRRDGHIEAADRAKELHEIVLDSYTKLINKEINIQTFKNNCIGAITNARPELEKHRGWKQVLGNLALAVIGVGVIYLIAVLINKRATGNFLFFKTDSAIKIDQLEQSLKSVIERN